MACLSVGCIVSMLTGDVMVLRDEVLPANLYSNIIAGALALVCLVRFVALLVRDGAAADDGKEAAVFTPPVVLAGLVSLAYTYGMESIGFYTSTFVCMFVLYFGFENWDKTKILRGLSFSLGLCALFYVTFTCMKIYLPDAMLF